MVKTIFLVMALIVAISSTFLLVRFQQESAEVNESLIKERYLRMKAEEQVQKDQSHIHGLENELKSAKEKIAKVQGILNTEQTAKQSLAEQYSAIQAEYDRLQRELEQQEIRKNDDIQAQADMLGAGVSMQ